MSWINMKARRSYDFVAPYTEEGERCETVVFPIAVKRSVENSKIVHDCNPQIVEIASDAAEATISVDTMVQAGSLMIVHNASAKAQTFESVACAAGKVTTLMFDGNGYISIGTTDISE